MHLPCACRKTTNRLRAIETSDLGQSRAGQMMRRKTTNRLRAIETLIKATDVVTVNLVARQLIACGRLKLSTVIP